MTGAGLSLAKAIKVAFPTGPPQEPPAVWLSRLPDREATLMADLNASSLDATVTEPMLVGAIERLQKLAAQREIRRRRQADPSPETTQETFLQNKALNPDARAPEPDEDEDPFVVRLSPQ